MCCFLFLLCSSLCFFQPCALPGAKAASSVVDPASFPEMVSRAPLYTTPNGYFYYMHLNTFMNPPLSSSLVSSNESSPFKLLFSFGKDEVNLRFIQTV